MLFMAACRRPALVAAAFLVAFGGGVVHAQKVRLKDGRVLTGAVAMTSGVADNPDKPGSQAGEIATKAEVGTLYLIHYPTGRYAKGDIAAEAGKTYKGKIIVATDFMTIDI